MALLMTPTLVPGAGFEIRDKFGTTTDLAVSHDYKPMPNTAVASAAESVQENAGFFIAISAISRRIRAYSLWLCLGWFVFIVKGEMVGVRAMAFLLFF
jgi:hypothetical protein